MRPHKKLVLADVDFEILAELPPFGSKLGYHTIGKTVKGLVRDKFGEGGLAAGAISGRLRLLALHEFVAQVAVLPVSSGTGYQITPRGEQLLEAHRRGEDLTPFLVNEETPPRRSSRRRTREHQEVTT